jgi:aspartyl-tRNA(Asn)/glutamyl-tRNA(Gln) amidotransferase subunit A
MRLRHLARRAMDALYSKYDALVAPSRTTVTYPIGIDFNQTYPGMGGDSPSVISAGNAAGQQAISVPNGFGADSLPTGIQFIGRAWTEARLLAIAHTYQQATNWHKQRPPL